MGEDLNTISEAGLSFYQKLANGEDVNILIVGDSIGVGFGASDQSNCFANRLAIGLQTTYNSVTRLTNVSLGSNSSYAGYVSIMSLNDGIDYDLVVICYGQNDINDNFGLFYEALIRAAKKRYPRASVISILESSQRAYTEKMMAIKTLAEHYDIPVVDTIAPFIENYDELVKDGLHPNDKGHLVYCEQLMNCIGEKAKNKCGFEPVGVAWLNDGVRTFENCRWYDSHIFTRMGNTFVLNETIQAEVFGIDCNFITGIKCCDIYIDGEKFVSPKLTFYTGTNCERRIRYLNRVDNGEIVEIKREIKVVYSNDDIGTDLATGFHGIAISGYEV